MIDFVMSAWFDGTGRGRIESSYHNGNPRLWHTNDDGQTWELLDRDATPERLAPVVCVSQPGDRVAIFTPQLSLDEESAIRDSHGRPRFSGEFEIVHQGATFSSTLPPLPEGYFIDALSCSDSGLLIRLEGRDVWQRPSTPRRSDKSLFPKMQKPYGLYHLTRDGEWELLRPFDTAETRPAWYDWAGPYLEGHEIPRQAIE